MYRDNNNKVYLIYGLNLNITPCINPQPILSIEQIKLLGYWCFFVEIFSYHNYTQLNAFIITCIQIGLNLHRQYKAAQCYVHCAEITLF